MAIIQSSYNNKVFQDNVRSPINTKTFDFFPFIKILNPFKSINECSKQEEIEFQIFFYSSEDFNFINFNIQSKNNKFDKIDVRGYNQKYYKIKLPADEYQFNFDFYFKDINQGQIKKSISFKRKFLSLYNLNVDLYDKGSKIDNILVSFFNERNLNIFYQASPIKNLKDSLYLYDLSDPNYQSRFPVNFFKFSDYNRKSFYLDKFNKVQISKNETMKFNTTIRCAYCYYDIFKKQNRLVLSPKNHYEISLKALDLVNKLQKFYPNEKFYQFYQNNPFNINETIVTTFYLP